MAGEISARDRLSLVSVQSESKISMGPQSRCVYSSDLATQSFCWQALIQRTLAATNLIPQRVNHAGYSLKVIWMTCASPKAMAGLFRLFAARARACTARVMLQNPVHF